MAERPDPRRLRVPGGWSGAQYDDSTVPAGASPLPLLVGPVSRYPLAEFGPHRSGEERVRPFEEERSHPPRAGDRETKPPGLYDLPALLSRIWSVPVTRMAKSGSYSTSPPDGGPSHAPDREIPFRPFEPRLEERDSFGEWSPSSHDLDPSLPLAAVPSLTMIPPYLPTSSADPPPSPPSSSWSQAAAVYSPITQYVAWRRPPCRVAYDLRLPRGIHCGRVSPAERAGAEFVRAAGYARALRRDWMMRPASSGWLLHREDAPVAIGA
ncbi:MAG: hypothetical protein WAK40_02285 [Thermoplasmata archaeon]